MDSNKYYNSVNETTNNTINNEVQNKTELTTVQKEENTRSVQTAISVSYRAHSPWDADGSRWSSGRHYGRCDPCQYL